MNKVLVVVDMQNDFIDGALGTKEAQEIVPNAVKKIKEWDGTIIFTLDSHSKDYLGTNEGKYLPVEHCIDGTNGHKINSQVWDAAISSVSQYSRINTLRKHTFGSTALPELLRGEEFECIELIGLCTDICVISNALLLKAAYPEANIKVDAKCCAGVTPAKHKAALEVMKSCQIEVYND